METSVVLGFVVYGLALFGWGALCFIVGKFVLWPFVNWLYKWLNGGTEIDADELEDDIVGSLGRLHTLLEDRLGSVELRVDGVELHSKENEGALKSFNARLLHMEDAAIKGLHERLLKVEEYVSSVDESKYKISSRLNQLEHGHENLTIQFATHRESFKLLVEALEASITKKKSLRGKSK